MGIFRPLFPLFIAKGHYFAFFFGILLAAGNVSAAYNPKDIVCTVSVRPRKIFVGNDFSVTYSFVQKNSALGFLVALPPKLDPQKVKFKNSFSAKKTILTPGRVELHYRVVMEYTAFVKTGRQKVAGEKIKMLPTHSPKITNPKNNPPGYHVSVPDFEYSIEQTFWQKYQVLFTVLAIVVAVLCIGGGIIAFILMRRLKKAQPDYQGQFIERIHGLYNEKIDDKLFVGQFSEIITDLYKQKRGTALIMDAALLHHYFEANTHAALERELLEVFVHRMKMINFAGERMPYSERKEYLEKLLSIVNLFFKET